MPQFASCAVRRQRTVCALLRLNLIAYECALGKIWRTASGVLHRLNASAKIAWQLLQQEPVSGDALSDVIAAYFNAPSAAVSQDIAVLLNALADAGLIIEQ